MEAAEWQYPQNFWMTIPLRSNGMEDQMVRFVPESGVSNGFRILDLL